MFPVHKLSASLSNLINLASENINGLNDYVKSVSIELYLAQRVLAYFKVLKVTTYWENSCSFGSRYVFMV